MAPFYRCQRWDLEGDQTARGSHSAAAVEGPLSIVPRDPDGKETDLVEGLLAPLGSR
jgi:hypothetical protein